jgi:hypothetical protein
VDQFYPECTVLFPLDDGSDPRDYNCAITVCPESADTRVLWDDVRIGFSTVKAACKSYDAGGQDHWDDQFFVEVYSNPGYLPALVNVINATMANGTVASEFAANEAADRHHSRDFATKRQQLDVRSDQKSKIRCRC